VSLERPEVAVGGIVIDDGRLLLVERGRGSAVGTWSIPGGRVERGETLAAAVEREVAEETGLSVRCGAFVGWVERISGDYHYVIMDFMATLVGSAAHAVAGDDAAALAWVPLEDVAAYPGLVPGLAAFLSEHGVLDGSALG
jgi:8-oxo-dGTP diphosphatase